MRKEATEYPEIFSRLVRKASGGGVQSQLNHDSEKLTNSEKVAENISGKSIIRAVVKTKNVPYVKFLALKTHCLIFYLGLKLTTVVI